MHENKKNMAVVLTCIDYRFWLEALALLKKRFNDFDLIALAGGSKNIASPSCEADKQAVLNSIKVSIDLHHANTLVLTNHHDCGAYGGSEKFDSAEKETDFHKKELLKAKAILGKIFPKLKIETIFINKSASGEIELI